MEKNFAAYAFEYVGAIQPERDRRDAVIEDLPQSKYRNGRNLPLHNYGRGPFCRFRVAQGWRQGGVYVLADGNKPLYVGECQDLESRWGTQGYGRISPRNCYQGGQETNCRINNLIYKRSMAGATFDLWFHPIEGGKPARVSVESELMAALKPPWNR